MSIRLSLRLKTIADMVDQDAHVADVGSDHAMLPVFLVQTGKIQWAEAIDNKIGPFLHMQQTIDQAGLSSHINAVKADGITMLDQGVDTLVIAGMGGMLACDILESHPEQLLEIKTVILDPHKDLIAVRKRVSDLGFHIVDETLILEDKIYYTIIKFGKGAPVRPYTLLELTFGPFVMAKGGETYRRYLLEQRKKVNDLLNKGISKEKRESLLTLYRMIRDELQRLGQD